MRLSIIDAMYVVYNLCACPGVAMHNMFSFVTEASLCKRRSMHDLMHASIIFAWFGIMLDLDAYVYT